MKNRPGRDGRRAHPGRGVRYGMMVTRVVDTATTSVPEREERRHAVFSTQHRAGTRPLPGPDQKGAVAVPWAHDDSVVAGRLRAPAGRARRPDHPGTGRD